MARVPYVDEEECTGCELCVETCPEVFRMNEEELSEVYDPGGAAEDQIQEAIDNCPVECIHWRDEE